ncbi:hypothetical protein JTB14_030310 [Gonioctena quinquepunctata]|nr:hypothetical protein JTB14_030310 [Gonioctena quinquepunctata]
MNRGVSFKITTEMTVDMIVPGSKELKKNKTVTLVEINRDQCSEGCEHLDTLLDLSSELEKLNKLLNKAIEEQQSSIGRLLAQYTRKSEEQDQPRSLWINVIKNNLWIIFGIIIIALFVISIISFQVLNSDENISIALQPITECKIENFPFITRKDWWARSAKRQLAVTGPIDMVIIKHTNGKMCESFQVCFKIVKLLQSWDAEQGHGDIYCNFLIGSDGSIYEGRGWGIQPEYRNDTLDIVFMGTFDIDMPTTSMINAALALLREGENKKYLTENYRVVCHNQTCNTLSPGQNIFREVEKWPHYDPNLHFDDELPNYLGEKNPENKTI